MGNIFINNCSISHKYAEITKLKYFMLTTVILVRLVDALLQFIDIDTVWWRMISAPPWPLYHGGESPPAPAEQTSETVWRW
jgi:ketosteroid isomerase-like protein